MKNVLLEAEQRIDALADELTITRLPIRPTLVGMYNLIDAFIHGARLGGLVPKYPPKSHALAGRLSYLLPIFAKCPQQPTGEDAINVNEAIEEADPRFLQRLFLATYGHFWEIMPEVRKGHYQVIALDAKQFRLEHKADSFSQVECKDIVLTELSLSSVVTLSLIHI